MSEVAAIGAVTAGRRLRPGRRPGLPGRHGRADSGRRGGSMPDTVAVVVLTRDAAAAIGAGQGPGALR